MGDLTQPNSGPARLRELIAGDAVVVAPGAYDALSARLVEQAGFDAVYMTGYGATASLLGRPDVGLLSMTEMADQARRFVSAVEVPVIADADNGYGGPLNVVRTVREYAAAGVAALHIEDQVVAEEVRPHGGQARHPAHGDGREGPRDGRGPRGPRRPAHRPVGRTGAGGPRQRARARRRVPRRRRRPHLRRRPAGLVGGASRSARRSPTSRRSSTSSRAARRRSRTSRSSARWASASCSRR